MIIFIYFLSRFFFGVDLNIDFFFKLMFFAFNRFGFFFKYTGLQVYNEYFLVYNNNNRGRSFGNSFGRSFGRSFDSSEVGQSVGQSFDHSFDRSFSRLVGGRLVGHLFDR